MEFKCINIRLNAVLICRKSRRKKKKFSGYRGSKNPYLKVILSGPETEPTFCQGCGVLIVNQ